MRTGQEVKDRALCLLGYTDADGCADAAMYADIHKRSLSLVNQIYADVWYALYDGGFSELSSLGDALQLPERVRNETMVYGVAMLMAQSLGDGDHQLLYADLYTQKRAILTHGRRRRDVMPRAV